MKFECCPRCHVVGWQARQADNDAMSQRSILIAWRNWQTSAYSSCQKPERLLLPALFADRRAFY